MPVTRTHPQSPQPAQALSRPSTRTNFAVTRTSTLRILDLPEQAYKILREYYRDVSHHPTTTQLEELHARISCIPGCESCSLNRLRVYFRFKRIRQENRARMRSERLAYPNATMSPTRRHCLTRPGRMRPVQIQALATQLEAVISDLRNPPAQESHPPKTFAELSFWLNGMSTVSTSFLDNVSSGAYAHLGLTAAPPRPSVHPSA